MVGLEGVRRSGRLGGSSTRNGRRTRGCGALLVGDGGVILGTLRLALVVALEPTLKADDVRQGRLGSRRGGRRRSRVLGIWMLALGLSVRAVGMSEASVLADLVTVVVVVAVGVLKFGSGGLLGRGRARRGRSCLGRSRGGRRRVLSSLVVDLQLDHEICDLFECRVFVGGIDGLEVEDGLVVLVSNTRVELLDEGESSLLVVGIDGELSAIVLELIAVLLHRRTGDLGEEEYSFWRACLKSECW